MNFFKNILSHVKQWFSSPHTLADEAKSASMAVGLLAPGLVFALQQAGVEDPAYSRIATEVQSDLNTLHDVLSQIAEGKTPTVTVVSVLQSVKLKLSPILDMAHIKNADTRAKITNAYNAFEAEIEVIANEFVPPQS